jgi:DNA-binding HxlR family transcriptional regulator
MVFCMHQYGQYCPLARAAEILADRWTILIVRELLVDVNNFNELERGLPGISRPLLAERLRRLVQANILERRFAKRGKRVEYRLTAAGRELRPVIRVLGEWGARWAFGDPRPNELDPTILMWWMRRRVCFDRIPRRRLVIQFNFRRAAKKTFWLLIESNEASICLSNPGLNIDLIVTADASDLYQVWFGRLAWSEAVRKSGVELDGAPADVRAFPQWFGLSPLAEVVRTTLADRSAKLGNRLNIKSAGHR